MVFSVSRPHYPILVIGAGPAGLTTAITLAREGVDVLVVESRTEDLAQPRATVLSLRTMEWMRAWGLEEQILAGGDDVDMAMLLTPTLARAAEGERIAVGYPSQAQSQVLSPTRAACVAQDHLERVLLDHLGSLPSATVARGVELVGLDGSSTGCRVELVEPATGLRRRVSAEYVVGADGARSRVRTALGVRMVGEETLLGGLMTEFRAPLWDVVGDHRYLLYGTTLPGAEGTVLPAGQGDRWLFGMQHELGDQRMTPGLAEVRRRIRLAAGVPDLPIRIERSAYFTSGAQLAERFQVDRVLLVGDAAHRITPRGGTGLNTAIADGIDLGWKLLWVTRGWAPESFLSTYETDRRPPAAHNVKRSADPLGSRRGPDTEVSVDLGGRLPHVWVVGAGDARSTDPRSSVDLVGSGLTLFVGTDAGDWRRTTVSVAPEPAIPPVDVIVLDRLSARALAVGSQGALLVRPDGVPVASWPSAAEPEGNLRHAVATLVRGQQPDVTRQPETAA